MSAITAARPRSCRITERSFPEYDVEQGMTTATGARLATVGIQSITDGTSNTALFSERLVAGYPFGSTATVYPWAIAGLCAIFTGSYAAAPNSVTVANMFDRQPGGAVCPGMPVHLGRDAIGVSGGDRASR